MSSEKNVQVDSSPVGVIGDDAKIEGGIHIHYHLPQSETPSRDVTEMNPPKPYAHPDPGNLRRPGGAMEPVCRFYIKRSADDAVWNEVCADRGIVTVRGARQTGKTSLINQIYSKIFNTGTAIRPVIVDFQAVSNTDFYSLNSIWRVIALAMENYLKLDIQVSDVWKPERYYDRCISEYLEQVIFKQNDAPVLICLDEADRVFLSPVKPDFFSSVRAFYNRGALDPFWKRIRWLISTSSEPSFFIENLTESPFNIGLKVILNAFTVEETAEFARRHGFKMGDSLTAYIMDFLGGHPYLLHLLFYHTALDSKSFRRFLDADSAGAGIFLDHLKRYLSQFQKEPDLSKVMKRVIAGKGCADVKMADRLEAAGLVKRDSRQNVVCFCRLYSTYFGKELK